MSEPESCEDDKGAGMKGGIRKQHQWNAAVTDWAVMGHPRDEGIKGEGYSSM
jgi:hypothetical protein